MINEITVMIEFVCVIVNYMAVKQHNPIMAAAATQRPGVRTLEINPTKTTAERYIFRGFELTMKIKPFKYLEKLQYFDGRKKNLFVLFYVNDVYRSGTKNLY